MSGRGSATKLRLITVSSLSVAAAWGAMACATPDEVEPGLPAGLAGTAGRGGNAGVAGLSGSAGLAGKGGSTAGSGGSTGASGSGGSSGSSGASGTGGASGSSGASGTAGTGGTAATGGTAGTAAGTGGTSGTAGKGGTAGTAGTGGMAGSSGAGGTAGSSGTAGAGGAGGSSAGTGGAAGSAGAPGCTLAGYAFCDDFEDGNANGWSPAGGTWSVVSDGSFVYTGGNVSASSTAGLASWTDQTVEARMKITNFGGSGATYRAGILARSGGSTSYYALTLDQAGVVRLLRGTSPPSGASGTCADVPSSLPAVQNTWVTLKIKVSGSASSVRILSWFNGAAVHDCTTTSSTRDAGDAGVMTNGSSTRAAFDDFRVSTP